MGSGGSTAGGESLRDPLLAQEAGTTHYRFSAGGGDDEKGLVELPTPNARKRSTDDVGCFGFCAPKDQNTADIDRMLKRDKKFDKQNVKKLLILGAGGSGKSTVFKQLKSIHGPGMNEKERLNYRNVVINNVIDFMKTLITKSGELAEAGLEHCRAGEGTAEAARTVTSQQTGASETYPKGMDAAVAAAIDTLWNDEGIRATFDERSRFQMQDSAEYYFNERMQAIKQPRYVPSEQDVLRSRVRTTGIIEQEFKVDNTHVFRVFDVGGQRNERRKWMHCFDNVTGVIFVASLSGYDQKLLEDDSTNRMKEALDLFAQINDPSGAYGHYSKHQGKPAAKERKQNQRKFNEMGKFFLEKPMILFLNKSDLFEKKIEKVKLSKCEYFKRYKYPMFKPEKKRNKEQQMSRYADGIKYIEHHFRRRNTQMTYTGRRKMVYVHVTNATDQTIMKKVTSQVQHILISQSLNEAGIM